MTFSCVHKSVTPFHTVIKYKRMGKTVAVTDVKLTKPSQGFDTEGNLIYFPKAVSSSVKTDRCCRR